MLYIKSLEQAVPVFKALGAEEDQNLLKELTDKFQEKYADQKFDIQIGFIKNLLLDNLLLVDIYNRAKKLHIEADVRRVVMILEMPQEKDHSSMESVKSLFAAFFRISA